MKEDSKLLPQDHYSQRLREMRANPGAVEKSSKVELTDFYGNAETWIVTTFRLDGRDIGFLQRINAEGGARWVLPEEVTEALARQRNGAVRVNRRRGAAAGVETRRAAGTLVPPPRPAKKAKRKAAANA